jgi:hypothetical protein
LTTTGLLLAPLFCLAMLLPPGWVLVAGLTATVFADGAVVNAGGKTVSVEWFVGLLVIGRVLFAMAAGRSGLRADILERLLPVLLYGLSCVASLLIALAWFQGEVIVLPGSAALNPLLAEPYRLMPENVNQLVYLALLLLLVYAVVHLASELPFDNLVTWIDRAMRCACGLATVIVLWHIASIRLGVWFPGGFFHSNLHSGAWDQMVAGVQRPSGSFAEPSALVYFFSAYLFYFWQRLRITGDTSDQFWVIVVVGILLTSTATTAVLALAVFAVLAALDLIASPRGAPAGTPGASAQGGLRLAHVLRLALVGAAVLAAAKFFQANADMVHAVLDEQVLNKRASLSYELRSNADRMAWRIFLDTYGLGLGFGSHRPSSGFLALLIGPGVLGTILFLLFVGGALRRPGSNRAAAASKPIRWAPLGPLVCHILTVPDFQSLTLWLPIALAVATHVRAAAGQDPGPGSPLGEPRRDVSRGRGPEPAVPVRGLAG